MNRLVLIGNGFDLATLLAKVSQVAKYGAELNERSTLNEYEKTK